MDIWWNYGILRICRCWNIFPYMLSTKVVPTCRYHSENDISLCNMIQWIKFLSLRWIHKILLLFMSVIKSFLNFVLYHSSRSKKLVYSCGSIFYHLSAPFGKVGSSLWPLAASEDQVEAVLIKVAHQDHSWGLFIQMRWPFWVRVNGHHEADGGEGGDSATWEITASSFPIGGCLWPPRLYELVPLGS